MPRWSSDRARFLVGPPPNILQQLLSTFSAGGGRLIGLGFGTVEVTISTSVGAASRPPGVGGRLATKYPATPSPILGPQIDKVLSPTCDCKTDTAKISFRLRKGDRLTVEVIDRNGDSVR